MSKGGVIQTKIRLYVNYFTWRSKKFLLKGWHNSRAAKATTLKAFYGASHPGFNHWNFIRKRGSTKNRQKQILQKYEGEAMFIHIIAKILILQPSQEYLYQYLVLWQKLSRVTESVRDQWALLHWLLLQTDYSNRCSFVINGLSVQGTLRVEVSLHSWPPVWPV